MNFPQTLWEKAKIAGLTQRVHVCTVRFDSLRISFREYQIAMKMIQNRIESSSRRVTANLLASDFGIDIDRLCAVIPMKSDFFDFRELIGVKVGQG